MIRVAVTGRTGQLALSLLDRVRRCEAVDIVAIGRPQLDLEKPELVLRALSDTRPDLIINAAAYTAVDRAEQEQALAFAVNCDGAGAVAAAAQSLGVPLVHLSTDYVYDGKKGAPYVETDATAPLNVYGRSKLAGEVAVCTACPEALILRTAWVYSPYGSNFIKTMLRLGAERPALRVVDDQWGNPTSAIDLADMLLMLAPQLAKGQGLGGLLHLAGSGHTTWCGLAREIFRVSKLLGGPSPTVEAIPSAAYPTPAARPGDTRLDLTSFQTRFGFTPRDWSVGLEDVVSRLIPQV